MTNLPTLDAPKAGRLTVQYAPADGATVTETPPRFAWLPALEEEARYALRVSQDPAFPKGKTQIWSDLPLNMLTPDTPLAPGDWYWSHTVWADGAPSATWDNARQFTVPDDAVQTPLAPRRDRWTTADLAHPRLWLSPSKLSAFQAAVTKDASHCAFDTFLAKSAALWMDREIIAEPKGYPGGKRTADVWRATYIECQEVIYAIRHLAIAGAVTQDAQMTARAKEWLLSVASWKPEGTTSRSYSDEWAFRINVALAWGYDWLYDTLSEDERVTVRTSLLARTRQTADHVIQNARIHLFPFDSHAVRAVSMVLVPAGIALLDDIPDARAWLDYATEFLSTLYSPWGDEQGGWAEGPHYWMTGMAYLIEAANLLRSFANIDLYQRPFFQHTGDFPLFTRAPTTKRAAFGDDATQGDAISLKMATNVRQFAGATGNGAYQWYHDQIDAADAETSHLFYNYGWWDFAFDEMMYQHDFGQVAATVPNPADNFRHFEGIGWACIQHRMDDPQQHVQLTFKSSPFGSVSHSHADQNAFTLSAFGEDLLINSGHYVAFGSSMHANWRRQTRSKNALLIDGKGQYGGSDKARALRANGHIISAEKREDHIFIEGDATAAYAAVQPDVLEVRRKLYFVHNEFLVIEDSIDLAKPLPVQTLLHSNTPYRLGARSFRSDGEVAGFYGEILWSEAGLPELTQETGFPGVDPADFKGLTQSTCLTATFPTARQHRIATLLVPYPRSAPRRIFHFLDDQGYDTNLYFTDAQDRSFKITIPKTLGQTQEKD